MYPTHILCRCVCRSVGLWPLQLYVHMAKMKRVLCQVRSTGLTYMTCTLISHDLLLYTQEQAFTKAVVLPDMTLHTTFEGTQITLRQRLR